VLHTIRRNSSPVFLPKPVDAFSMSNGFILPEPLSGEDKVEWTVKKNKLLEEFMKSYKG